jgi:hypothetical protein
VRRALFLVLTALAGCKSTAFPCDGCRADGEPCQQSIECRPGSICNDPSEEDLYRSASPLHRCLKVICASTNECPSGEDCTLENVCRPHVCQGDAECAGGMLCEGGACVAPLPLSAVASCEVVRRARVMVSGSSAAVSAVARDAEGHALAHSAFAWSSSDVDVVSIVAGAAHAGAKAGAAELSAASVPTMTACAGSVHVVTLPPIPPTSVRVVVTQDDGSPIEDALVSVVTTTGAVDSRATDAQGSAVFDGLAVESITASAPERRWVSVLRPGTNDVRLRLVRDPLTASVSGGARGWVRVASGPAKDVRLGIAGAALSANALDLDPGMLAGSSPIPTFIDAPALGFDHQTLDLPEGLMFAIGERPLTVSEPRCQSAPLTFDALGCYVLPGEPGPTAFWTISGAYFLHELTQRIDPISSPVMTGLSSPLLELLFSNAVHGLEPNQLIAESPQIQTATGAAPDYTRYDDPRLFAATRSGVLSRVSLPELPVLPSGSRSPGAIAAAFASLGPRGIVPLGVVTGQKDPGGAQVIGDPFPFGAASDRLEPGELGLSSAPPHAGLEGSQRLLIAVALDTSSMTSAEMSAVIRKLDRFDETIVLDRSFPSYPGGRLDVTSGRFVAQDPAALGDVVRIDILSGRATWSIYAASSRDVPLVIDLPAVDEVLDVRATFRAARISTLWIDRPYASLWSLADARGIDDSITETTAFASEPCAPDGLACIVQ